MGFPVHPNAKFAALMKEAEKRTKDELEAKLSGLGVSQPVVMEGPHPANAYNINVQQDRSIELATQK